jgi:hypothetical protein
MKQSKRLPKCTCGVKEHLQMAHLAYSLNSNKYNQTICPMCRGEYNFNWGKNGCQCKKPTRCKCKTRYMAVGNYNINYLPTKCNFCTKCGKLIHKFYYKTQRKWENIQEKLNRG